MMNSISSIILCLHDYAEMIRSHLSFKLGCCVDSFVEDSRLLKNKKNDEEKMIKSFDYLF